ncbi:hypothetical protein TREPR_3092 [Treponema primitia ZAS-2]|uniref:Uncharacterized protein n=1 Tax=Treponema primitia (strain ATCC BAA-887 / DSM 12427 / ZAS-2) TaxID=545694 RepID=F5YML6_TREPZ|nr:hypothetical protein TREPR_3092 [Treponema primitia ZAS-2]
MGRLVSGYSNRNTARGTSLQVARETSLQVARGTCWLKSV